MAPPAGRPARPEGSWIERWLTRWFPCTLFDGSGRCPYLYRWRVIDTTWIKIFVHQFVGDDWSRDLHDHSARFISIGLSGAYVEETPEDSQVWLAPWIRSFPATHRHRIRLLTSTVWTLVITGPWQRESGFWIDGHWMQSARYRISKRADEQKSC